MSIMFLGVTILIFIVIHHLLFPILVSVLSQSPNVPLYFSCCFLFHQWHSWQSMKNHSHNQITTQSHCTYTVLLNISYYLSTKPHEIKHSSQNSYLYCFTSITVRGCGICSGLMGSTLDSGESAGWLLFLGITRHFTLTVPLSTQEYQWLQTNC